MLIYGRRGCAIFGIIGETDEWALSVSGGSSYAGSIFYLLSGICQWYESVQNEQSAVAFEEPRYYLEKMKLL